MRKLIKYERLLTSEHLKKEYENFDKLLKKKTWITNIDTKILYQLKKGNEKIEVRLFYF